MFLRHSAQFLCALSCCVAAGSAHGVFATDWPMWRFDARRSAASPAELPETLHLEWTIQGRPLKAAWPEDRRLQFDAVYEPIVADSRMFIASNRDDSVSAIDVETAAVLWRFHAGGPVRFAPVARDGKIYFGADDGALYALDAASGAQVWRFLPRASRKVLGNDRLISVHPVRGGPVIADGQIHFSSGVWPFEGTFLYSAPLDGGASAPQFSVVTLGDVVPQGYLVAVGDRVILPGGRAKVSSYRTSDGGFDHLKYDAKGFTDYHASASDTFLFHGNKVLNLETNHTYPISAPRPVTGDARAQRGTRLYSTVRGDVRAVDLSKVRTVEAKDRKGKIEKRRVLDELWRLPNEEIANAETIRELREAGTEEKPEAEYLTWLQESPMVVAIRSGKRIYGYQRRTVFAIDLPEGDDPASVSWKTELSGTPGSLLSAAGRLFVVTREGAIHSFSATAAPPRQVALRPRPKAVEAPQSEEAVRAATLANRAVTEAGTDAGYCVLLGAGSGSLLDGILRASRFHVIVLESDLEIGAAAQRRLDAAGLYGERATVHVGDDLLDRMPPYLANLVVSEKDLPDESIDKLFRLLRPYGGTAVWRRSEIRERRLAAWVRDSDHPDARTLSREGLSILRREGALPGSADWAREYADEGNTLMSRDSLVKAPLGVLWFGGPAGDSDLFYNRHNWPPSLSVVDGRMFIQGPGTLVAVDIYTGRILWRKKILDGGGSPARRRELTLVSGDRMGNPIFGTPPAGYHFLVEKDALYLAYPGRCLVLDPQTGRQTKELKLPRPDREWGRIRSYKGLLIVSVLEADTGDGKQRLPLGLIAMDRHTGAVKWKRDAEGGLPFVAAGQGRLFCYDARLENPYRDRRRGNAIPKTAGTKTVLALDAETGAEQWATETDMTATWLAFSDQHNVLVASNSEEILAVQGSDGAELWRKKAKGVGFKGHPENLVHKVILWHDRVIDQRGPGLAYNLKSGSAQTTRHPLTREEVPWGFTKNGHHCNYAIASEHLLTFRAATAGFLDMKSGGTSHLRGFRSGCRNSLIPAGGVLNAPNFAHGCVCSYHIFTSLALVHVPRNEQWAYSAHKAPAGRIRSLGINLGAPGDRRADNGTLWLDYPNVGGPSPRIRIRMQPESIEWFRQHASLVEGERLTWVAASGARGLTSISIVLADDEASNGPATKYTARLYFSEPDRVEVGERVFGVKIQGREVVKELDIVKEAGGRNRVVVKEFLGVKAESELSIELTAASGTPILSGVEIVAEEDF